MSDARETAICIFQKRFPDIVSNYSFDILLFYVFKMAAKRGPFLKWASFLKCQLVEFCSLYEFHEICPRVLGLTNTFIL